MLSCNIMQLTGTPWSLEEGGSLLFLLSIVIMDSRLLMPFGSCMVRLVGPLSLPLSHLSKAPSGSGATCSYLFHVVSLLFHVLPFHVAPSSSIVVLRCTFHLFFIAAMASNSCLVVLLCFTYQWCLSKPHTEDTNNTNNQRPTGPQGHRVWEGEGTGDRKSPWVDNGWHGFQMVSISQLGFYLGFIDFACSTNKMPTKSQEALGTNSPWLSLPPSL